MKPGTNSLDTLDTLQVLDETFHYFNLNRLSKQGWGDLERLPYSLKVLLENILRFETGGEDAVGDIEALVNWVQDRCSDREIAFRPTRVLMQDFTGVPAVVDLAAMRDAVASAGGNPDLINPQIPVDLVIDHSVMVDEFATAGASTMTE